MYMFSNTFSMRKWQSIVWCIILVFAVQVCLAQQAVQYAVTLDNAIHHEAQITATFTDLGQQPLQALMSRSSPGRYALHEFAKHVYNLEATDSQGRKLQVVRPNPYEWHIPQHDGTVTIRYTLFGNRADGTYTGITDRYAHFNIPATFMWARGLENRPVVVSFKIPEGKNWQVATQLKPEQAPNTFSAPDMQYFMDSPTVLGNFTFREQQVQDRNRTQTIRLALLHEGTPQEADEFMQRIMQVVLEQQAVFGELPEFDFGTYTFIASYLPEVAGDGMEHRNSTIVTSTRPLSTGVASNMGTVSHEFFHAWNVERLRPRSLEPFDFERANMSGELWMAEGFTSYYGDLALARAGQQTLREYAASLGGTLNYVLNSPGFSMFNAVEMSQQAPYVDAATSIEPHNRANTYISYYPLGSVIALALDLKLRTEFKNLSLDQYMRDLWHIHGRPEKPYNMENLRAVLAQTTRNQDFTNHFFDSYILGRQAAPYKELLARAGMLLRNKGAGTATLGRVSLRNSAAGLLIESPVLRDSPLYKAGLESGDIITQLDGNAITSEKAYQDYLKTRRPGEPVRIEWIRYGQAGNSTATFAEANQLEVVLYEDAGMQVTRDMQRFRTQWLGSKKGTR
jgi:predicted metalloprotease with PDZ domain